MKTIVSSCSYFLSLFLIFTHITLFLCLSVVVLSNSVFPLSLNIFLSLLCCLPSTFRLLPLSIFFVCYHRIASLQWPTCPCSLDVFVQIQRMRWWYKGSWNYIIFIWETRGGGWLHILHVYLSLVLQRNRVFTKTKVI